MITELKVNGTQKFMGIDIPIVEGGFGENCRVVTDKTIAEIHKIKMFKVRERINHNITRFKENIDYLDIKRILDTDTLIDLGYAKQSITQAENIFLLSERGYAKLIKIMDSDKAWEVHDALIDEYFAMRKIINSNEQLKSMLLLDIYNGGQTAIYASKKLSEMEAEAATACLRQKIKDDEPFTEFGRHVTDTENAIDMGDFAKILVKKNINIGRNRLFKWLREQKILMKNNVPYQAYLNSGWFTVIEAEKITSNGHEIYLKTLVTGLGQMIITNRLKKHVRNLTNKS